MTLISLVEFHSGSTSPSTEVIHAMRAALLIFIKAEAPPN
jgi:hypothetical protein